MRLNGADMTEGVDESGCPASEARHEIPAPVDPQAVPYERPAITDLGSLRELTMHNPHPGSGKLHPSGADGLYGSSPFGFS